MQWLCDGADVLRPFTPRFPSFFVSQESHVTVGREASSPKHVLELSVPLQQHLTVQLRDPLGEETCKAMACSGGMRAAVQTERAAFSFLVSFLRYSSPCSSNGSLLCTGKCIIAGVVCTPHRITELPCASLHFIPFRTLAAGLFLETTLSRPLEVQATITLMKAKEFMQLSAPHNEI